MQRRNIINSPHLHIIVNRLCRQLIENHGEFENTVLIGMQPRGVFLAKKIQKLLHDILLKKVPLGILDTTFYRDDFKRRELQKPYSMDIPFSVEGKKVILIDDVLYTGRTVRAAMDALIDFGRPSCVELMVLIDRIYSRELPVEAHYIGKKVNSLHSEKVWVELSENDFDSDNVWLIEKTPKT
ncbi:MAG: bifunctional pyr operon transcriptional regulator/uracil phosphoribosyltransferase PyrR [Cytophagales bacterium]